MNPPRKTGYTPVSWAMLDANITGDAALLLLRMRRQSDEAETDGYVEDRDLRALAAFHELPKGSVARSIAELTALGLIENVGRLYKDTEFETWCRTHEQREELRRDWRETKQGQRHKPQLSTQVSMVDSQQDRAGVSSVSPSVAPSEAPTPAAAPTPGALQESENEETFMPRQADTITLREGWESIVGRDCRIDEVSHLGWLLDTYHRLTANQILEVIERTYSRELTKGSPMHPLNYYDGPIRDANDLAKPTRLDPEPLGEGEPPIERGNGHASAEQVREAVAALAASKRL